MTHGGSALTFLSGGGEMGERLRAHDWASTPLGPPESWPTALATVVSIMLNSSQAMFTTWGDERTMLYNDRYAQILGRKHPHALGRPYFDVWHELVADVKPIMDRAYAGEPTHMDDIQLETVRHGYKEETHFNFSYTPIRDEHGNVAGVFCPCMEITEQAFAQRALRVSEARLQAFFSNAAVGMAQSDIETGRLLRVNHAFCEITGYSEAELLERTIRDLTHPLDREDDWSNFQAAFRGSAPHYSVEKRLLRSDGETIWVRVNVGLVQVSDSGQQRTAAVIEDITSSKRIEEALRESEERLRLAAESTGFGTYDFNPLTRRLIWSKQLKLLCGLPPDETVDVNVLLALVHPEDRERFLAETRAALIANSEDTYEIEFRIVRSDGQVRWLRDRGRVFFQTDGPTRRPARAVGAIIDVTDQKRVEEVLRESENLFRTMADTAPAMIWMTDEQHRPTFLSRGWYEFTGHLEAKNQGFGWTAATHPEDRDRVSKEFLQAAEQQVPFQLEYRLRKADGTYGWAFDAGRPRYNADGAFLGYIGSVIDITQRKRAEEASRETEERFRALVSQVKDYAIFSVDREGRVTSWNEGCQRVLGYARDEFLGFDTALLFTAEDRALGVPQRELEVAASSGTADDDRWLVAHGGRKFFAEGVTTALYNRSGELYGYSKVIRDQTEWKQAEQALSESEERLRQLNSVLEDRVRARTAQLSQSEEQLREIVEVAQRRAEQLRTLTLQLARAEQLERRRLAGVLHDHVQQLLVAAKMRVGILSREVPEEASELLEGVNVILDNALDASRSLSVDLAPPILHSQGLAAALNWLAERMENQHHLQVTVETEDEQVSFDQEETRDLLFQAARELLLNVVKHAKTDKATVRMVRDEGWTRLEVRDAGVGFEPGEASEMPSSFGLFHMRERLEAIGGRLTIESEPGQGTTATIAIPHQSTYVPPAAAEAQQASESAEIARPLEKWRVLLADDHQLVREGLQQILHEESNIEVVGHAADGQEAVELARQLQPDVVVMDVNMPELDGIEATRRLNSELPAVRIVGLSLHDDADTARSMIAAGAWRYLSKVRAAEELVELIRSLGQPER